MFFGISAKRLGLNFITRNRLAPQAYLCEHIYIVECVYTNVSRVSNSCTKAIHKCNDYFVREYSKRQIMSFQLRSILLKLVLVLYFAAVISATSIEHTSRKSDTLFGAGCE